jgi:4-diphosphocytidyl-2-C-methyl-D-erythritol kinase
MTLRALHNVPAPAKLNLFLHVVGRRPDGYHELQTVFALIDLADWVDVHLRSDGQIHRHGDLAGTAEADLASRAANALQQATGTRAGADITVLKHIPAGSGLGGGSSDAATTLLALNALWRTGLAREDLANLALGLGADVPFFVQGSNAFAEGIGERLTPLRLGPLFYALIWPQVHVPTKEIFADSGLTRTSKLTKMADFSAAVESDPTRLFGVNDLQAVTRRRVPEVDEALRHLERFGPARMTGSGSAVFMPTDSEARAKEAVARLPSGWKGWVVRGLPEHPLAGWSATL